MSTLISKSFKAYFAAFSGLSKSTWNKIAVHFTNSLLGGIFYFLSYYFVTVLHINMVISGYLIASYGIGTILGGFIGGKLSDYISSKKILVVSLFVQALGYFFLIKIENPFFLTANLFLMGIASYSFITANYLYILNSVNNENDIKLKVINILSMASNLGLTFSAFIITALSTFGFRNIFLIVGCIFLLSSFYLFCKKDNVLKVPSSPTDNVNATHNANNKKFFKSFIIVIFSVFFTGAVIAQLSTTYSIYLKNIFPAFGLYAVSCLFILNSVIIVFFEAPFVALFKNFNKLLMTGIGALLIGIGMLLLNFAFVFTIAILSCVIYTLGEMLFFSMAQFVCYDYAHENKKGQSLGIFRMVYASSRVVGPALGGLIYFHLGGPTIWYLCALIGVFCFALCFYGKKTLFNYTATQALSTTT